ncbi:hypothetical protein VCHC78A1_03176B, partial [Vibrio cholerae HC-78A1]
RAALRLDVYRLALYPNHLELQVGGK